MTAGDDNDPNVPSAFVTTLASGTQYFLVSTGFANTDSGTYTLFGAGTGVVTFTPVPEPTFVMAAFAGIGLIGTRLRKQTVRIIA